MPGWGGGGGHEPSPVLLAFVGISQGGSGRWEGGPRVGLFLPGQAPIPQGPECLHCPGTWGGGGPSCLGFRLAQEPHKPMSARACSGMGLLPRRRYVTRGPGQAPTIVLGMLVYASYGTEGGTGYPFTESPGSRRRLWRRSLKVVP